MKTLFLIRHAKSSWNSFDLSDFDRSLNERGLKNAPEMANRLLKKNIVLDAIFSSPAKRALTTAKIFAEVLGFQEKIVEIPDLYEAEISAYFDLIRRLDNKSNVVAIFAHNPEITDFVNNLGLVNLDNMPTCGIFAFRVDADDWSNFSSARKEFLFFDYPKAIG